MKKLYIASLCLILAGCAKDPLSSERTANPNFNVDKLFEIDGCNVYRFSDYGRSHYLTTCPGSSTISTYSVSCGKGCTRTEDDEIPTIVYRGKL